MTASRTEVVVVGGGAAGTMAAAVAAERGLSVTLLEPNRELGRKLRITGKGRCNLTNDCTVREFMDNVPRNAKFLSSALHRLSPADVMELFESLGVPLKTERGRRVFPRSDRAADIAEALGRRLTESGVGVIRAKAHEIVLSEGRVVAVNTDAGKISCSSVILCTGGLSYPATGSNGDGLRIARRLGHNVCPCSPSLVPLCSTDEFCARLQGLSLRNVRLRAYEDGKQLYDELGELLFTHFGLSGPLVLSASAHMRGFGSHEYRLSIDLKPALDSDALNARILRDFADNLNRDFRNSLDALLPRLLIPVVVERSGIPELKKVNSVTREERSALVSLLKAFTVTVSEPRPISEAIITSGGVDVREVDPRTMGSRLIPGLYFAGEILDVDAYTGGYNLQIAWSTGYVAGSSVKGDSGIE